MKNLKSVIVNGILIALGVLFLGFMAGTYMPGDFPYSGYKLTDTCVDLMKVSHAHWSYGMFAVPTILAIICLCLVIVLAVVNLLIALDVIKNEKLANILNKVQILLTVLAVIFVALSFIGYYKFSEGKYGYALIINLIVAFAAAVVAIYNKVTAKADK